MQNLTPKIFKDGLTTTDESGHRIRVIPMVVKGYFQSIRDKVHIVLLAFFLMLPWIKIGDYPALQLDVPHRHFYFLGHLFLPQDAPDIFFIIGTFAIALLFFTTLYGRVWCGWACPQTVFIEGFFRRIERWVEGSHVKQRELDRRNWDFYKIRTKGFKWFLFTVGSLVVTHSFLAYFIGTDQVLHIILHPPSENPGSFAVVMVSTFVILFDFGWFREQFCLVACPYGRFQSALMDDQSLTIAYDIKRGEPRKDSAMLDKSLQGDCINCLKCVRVCPTGIDIRNGFQMECIACTACIDACDEVMVKSEKPTGLIRYMSEKNFAGVKHGLVRPRSIIYGFLLLLMIVGLGYRISNHKIYQTELLRAIDTPYQILKSPSGDFVINHFKVNWYNLTPENVTVEINLPPELIQEGFELIQSQNKFEVTVDKQVHHQFFIKFPVAIMKQAQREIIMDVHWVTQKGPIDSFEKITIVGPDKSL